MTLQQAISQQIRRTWTLMFLNREITFSDDENDDEEEDNGADGIDGKQKKNDSPIPTKEEFSELTEKAELSRPKFRTLSVRFDDKPIDLSQKPNDSDSESSSKGSHDSGHGRRRSVVSEANFVFDATEIDDDDNGDDNGDSDSDSNSDGDDDDYDDTSIDMANNRQNTPTQGSWQFMPGTRSSSLRRNPTKTVVTRPTTELIADKLDEFFPDHDLDKPIIQSVRLPSDLVPVSDASEGPVSSIFSANEINVVMEDDDPNMPISEIEPQAITSTNNDTYSSQNITKAESPVEPSEATAKSDESRPLQLYDYTKPKDVHVSEISLTPRQTTGNAAISMTSSTINPEGVPVSRRKSVRMLVRESRIHQSVHYRPGDIPPVPRYRNLNNDQDQGSSTPSTNNSASRHLPPRIMTSFNKLPEDKPSNTGRGLGFILSAAPKDVRAVITPTSSEPNSGYQTSNSSTNLSIPQPHTSELTHQLPLPTNTWSSTADSWNSPSFNEPKPPTFLRRRSTKMWGGIPEEIRPKRRGIARIRQVSSSNTAHVPDMPQATQTQDPQNKPDSSEGATDADKISNASKLMTQKEIVQRALSLLQRPDHSYHDEQMIIESAIKQGLQNSTIGTRRQLTEQQARWDIEKDPHLRSNSLSSTAQALFAMYGPPSAPIKIQWLKGRQIGKGSFGRVYIALNALNGELIAVKQINVPSLSEVNQSRKSKYKELIQQLYSEIELLKDFEHENIVQYLGFNISKSTMNIFLEYVPGGTVNSLIHQYGPLAEPVVHSFLQQILAGLEYLHSHNILHRDIKGANILVNEQGICKISDFGISKKAHQNRQAYDRHTRTSRSVKGTLYWMAPELVRSEGHSAKVDVWALGCVTIEMWSGKRPWSKFEIANIMYQIGKSRAPPLPTDLTSDGLDFCHQCLQPNPEDRWTATQLRSHKFAQTPPDYRYNDYYTTD